jgi:hypothetical protein
MILESSIDNGQFKIICLTIFFQVALKGMKNNEVKAIE